MFSAESWMTVKRGSLKLVRIFATKTSLISKMTKRAFGFSRSRIYRVTTPSPGPSSTTISDSSGSMLPTIARHKKRELGDTLPVDRMLRKLSRRNVKRRLNFGSPKILVVVYALIKAPRSGYFFRSPTASAFEIRIPLINAMTRASGKPNSCNSPLSCAAFL